MISVSSFLSPGGNLRRKKQTSLLLDRLLATIILLKMNTLHHNSDQISNPAEIQRYFQEDPQFAAQAATYLYFQLLELSQNQKLLEKQYDRLIQQFFGVTSRWKSNRVWLF